MRQLKINRQITGRNSLSIEKYLQEIGKIDVLTTDEEVRLAKASREGDKEAKEQLVLANLRFVVSVAKQYQNYGLTLEDLINEGNLGLLKAVEQFDETKGFKFISYAVWWIRQSILQAIADNARLIRLPLNRLTTINRLAKISSKLEQKLQREPSPEELSAEMQVDLSSIEENIKISIKPISIDAPLTNEEDSLSIKDVYVTANNEKQIDVFNASLLYDSLRTDLDRLLSLLNSREVEILSMYYGLKNKTPMSLDEIGTALGLTSERVRQLKTRALKKLKDLDNNARYKSYL